MANIPITPLSVTEMYRPTEPTVVFTADRVVSWSVSGGASVQNVIGTSTVVTFPNKTQTIVVTAVSGADSGSASLIVYGMWPVFPHFGAEISVDDKVLASYAEDGSAVFRRKGGPKHSWTVSFNNAPTTDWRLIRDFWNFHRKDIPFFYEDVELPENVIGSEISTLRLVTCDTGLKIIEEGPDRYTITVAFRQV